MTTPDAPATNDPEPWRYYDGSRRAEPLNQDAGNPFASLWSYDPRPEFDAEVPADEGTLRKRLRDAFDEGTSNFGTGFWAVVATELQKARAEGEVTGRIRAAQSAIGFIQEHPMGSATDLDAHLAKTFGEPTREQLDRAAGAS